MQRIVLFGGEIWRNSGDFVKLFTMSPKLLSTSVRPKKFFGYRDESTFAASVQKIYENSEHSCKLRPPISEEVNKNSINAYQSIMLADKPEVNANLDSNPAATWAS